MVDGIAHVLLLPLHVLQGECRFCLLCLLSRVGGRWDSTRIVTTGTCIKRGTSVLCPLFVEQGQQSMGRDGTNIVTTVTCIEREMLVLSSLFVEQGQ